MRWLNCLLAAGLAFPAFGVAAAEVTGTASYRDRMALPAGALFEAVLEDVPLADAAAVELGRAAIRNPGTPPFSFEIDYDPARIEPDRRYTVRAQISLDGQLLYASEATNPVLTGGASPAVDVGMVRIAGGPADAAPDMAGATVEGLRLPAGFVGELPCADCDGIDFRLDLWPDQVFHLRRAWDGKDMQRDSIGRWTVEGAAGIIALRGADEIQQFRVLGPDRLEAIPREGAPPAAGASAVLTAEAEFRPFEPHLPLRGMLTYTADAAHFTECLTGRDYPLVPDRDFPALEHAYLAAGEAGGPVMASFDGGIVEHPPAAGGAPVPSVLVERFVGIWPGETCERAMGPATLTNTYWKILRLGETEIAAAKGRREPSLVLREGALGFNATVGCNQFVGSYALQGDSLTFRAGASTRTACPPPLDDWERLLAGTLAQAGGWRIDGQTLELTDRDGKGIALLQAMYLY